MEKIEDGLAEKCEKKMKISEKESLKMTSIPKESADAKALADMVKTGKQYVNVGGVQVINGLVLAQFELQASQGQHFHIIEIGS